MHIVKWFVGLCCFLGGCSYGLLGLGILCLWNGGKEMRTGELKWFGLNGPSFRGGGLAMVLDNDSMNI